MNRRYLIGLLVAVLAVAAVAYFFGGGQTPAGQPPLRNLTAGNIEQIEASFNAAKSEVRVLLLLSPT